MENKHSKYFIVRQSKRLKFTPKMRQNTFCGRALPGPAGELKRSPTPLTAMRGLLLREEGREGGEGREG